MNKLSRLRARLIKAKPWVFVAVSLSILLIGYYGLLAFRYWTASKEVSRAASEISRMSALLRQQPSDSSVGQRLAEQSSRQEELRALYFLAQSDDLVALVSGAAFDAGVQVTSIGVGDPTTSAAEGVQFQTQPIVLTLQGDFAAIEDFLTLLQARSPAMAVSGMGLSGVGDTLSTQISLLFYLSPQPVEAPKPPKALVK